MSYENYERLVVLRYGVKLEGWPEGIPFHSPSKVLNSPDLKKLRDALLAKTCRWVRLERAQIKALEADLQQREADGSIPKKVRKKRSDAGKKRKKDGGDNAEDQGDEEDEDVDESEDEEEEEERPRKRQRKTSTRTQPPPAPSHKPRKGLQALPLRKATAKSAR